MMRTFKFRCYPRNGQTEALNNMIDLARNIWNIALQDRKDFYAEATGKELYVDNSPRAIKQRENRAKMLAENPEYASKQKRLAELFRMDWSKAKPGQTSRSYQDQCLAIRLIRNEFPEYKEIPYTPIQRVLKDLHLAYEATFRRIKEGGKPGFPKFKSRNRIHQSLKFMDRLCLRYGEGMYGYIKIQTMPGKLRFKMTNPAFYDDSVVIKTSTITRDHKGFCVSFACEMPDVVPYIPKGVVGIDLGVSKFVTVNDGTVFENPRLYEKNQAELRRRQRAVERCVEGSGNHRRVKKEVVRLHADIANARETQHYSVASKLTNMAIKETSVIAIEDLSVRGLLARNRKPKGEGKQKASKQKVSNKQRKTLNKQLLDAGMGSFILRLESTAEKNGVRVVRVPPEYSSQDCSSCGTRVPKSLSVRIHYCSNCGLVMDRDQNAAINIAKRGVEAIVAERGAEKKKKKKAKSKR